MKSGTLFALLSMTYASAALAFSILPSHNNRPTRIAPARYGTTATTQPHSLSVTRAAAATAIESPTTTNADSSTEKQSQPSHDHDDNSDNGGFSVRAPLKYVGPYPCLALRFPGLSTDRQRSSNNATATGVGLDFVLDTAANTNTIQQPVAAALQLNVVGRALPGVGATGAIEGADTYLLGDAQLEGTGIHEPFLSELTAAALPVANPAAAGLLSLAFFQVFEGGVEFQWGTPTAAATAAATTTSDDATATTSPPPSVTFHGDKSRDDVVLRDLTKIPLQRVPVTNLATVLVTINGVELPALLDTGSPITVMNAAAAEKAGVATTLEQNNNKKMNPVRSFQHRLKEAQAAARGDVLFLQGSDGQRISLAKSSAGVPVQLRGDDSDDIVDLGASVPLYVGDLPGLAALGGIGGIDASPAVVLGLDVLRQRPSMLLRAQDNEVWFS